MRFVFLFISDFKFESFLSYSEISSITSKLILIVNYSAVVINTYRSFVAKDLFSGIKFLISSQLLLIFYQVYY